ncbi:MAG TPA: pseudouridine synthase [Gemmatimonadaceae bacterium]|nr:pseudouridine synthase [Gemmatimonadaceae bacterium]
MTADPMRIQRALARAGVASRRSAEELVLAGRITVNGTVAKTGQVVDPTSDDIRVDGRRIEAPRAAEWIVLHKPAGVLTSRPDGTDRRNVFDIVPSVPGLTYVGRLDFLTEGVLLLTTDGEAAHALTHPSRGVERSYLAVVRGDAEGAALDAARGVKLEDGVVTPSDISVRWLRRGVWEFAMTIREGKTHEVRRICETLGLEVERLIRTRFGPVMLGDLPVGAQRGLTLLERRAIEQVVRPGQKVYEEPAGSVAAKRSPGAPRKKTGDRSQAKSGSRPKGKGRRPRS